MINILIIRRLDLFCYKIAFGRILNPFYKFCIFNPINIQQFNNENITSIC